MSKKEIVRDHYGKYQVIHLNLVGMPSDYQTAFSVMWEKIGNSFRDHDYLKYSHKLDSSDKKNYSTFTESCPTWSASKQALLENSLVYLYKLLFKHHGNGMRCAVLVDEFDALVTNSMFDVSSDELSRIIKLRDVVLSQNIILTFTMTKD